MNIIVNDFFASLLARVEDDECFCGTAACGVCLHGPRSCAASGEMRLLKLGQRLKVLGSCISPLAAAGMLISPWI